MIITGILLLFLCSWLLGIYTTSGRTIIVPQITGYTIDEIKESVRNSDLEYVVIDSLYKTGERPGVIIVQIPNAGKKVKKGRKILVTINAYTQEMTTMPQLVDYSLRNAEVVLQTAGLQLDKVEYKPSQYHDLILEQLVNGQPINQGTRLPKGTKITLIVGAGDNNEVAIAPDLLGLSLRDARIAMANANFNIGNIFYDETIHNTSDSITAVVFKQTPIANAPQTPGSPINVWLTTDVKKTISNVLQ